MSNEAFNQWLLTYRQQALALNERRLIVLVGEQRWTYSLLTSAGVIENDTSDRERCFIFSDNKLIPPNVSLQRFRDKLGSESHTVVFADSQYSIDALAVLSGTLVAGGVLFLLIDDYAELEKSLFFQRFLALVNRMPAHVIIEQKKIEQNKIKENNFYLSTLEPTFVTTETIAQTTTQTIAQTTPKVASVVNTAEHTLNYACVTQEQVTAVDAIIKVATGKRKRPLVLTADRGRGKSSALAIASAQLLMTAKKDNPLNIIITATDVNSLQVFFKQLQVSLPTGELHSHSHSHSNSHSHSHRSNSHRFTYKSDHGVHCVEFIAIDQLIKQPLSASLVLVDEAAAIPVYLLEQLVDHYHRMVFASTVHGYEGAGRGFTLKFQQKLALTCPNWRCLHIQQPIRYREHDPLEQLIFSACMLNAELEELPTIELPTRDLPTVDLQSITFKHFSANALAKDETLLAQVVSVLVTAHYQTKPSDIKMLLDNPYVQVVCLLSNRLSNKLSKGNGKQQVVAVAMLIREGNSGVEQLSELDIAAISHSQKRLSNHFTPQSLLTQCGMEQAFDFYYLRVMRIAVHVQLQQQGLGSQLLEHIAQFAQLQGADFIASSFGATKSLLSFWLKHDYHIARLGFTKDKASGEHSALVLKAVSSKVLNIETDLKHEFYRSFDFLLNDEYQWLAADLIALIQHYCPKSLLVELTAHDLANVSAFTCGHRQYSCCVFSLHLWLKSVLVEHPLAEHTLVEHTHLSEQSGVAVLIQRIMQKHNISTLCRQHNFNGKKELEQFLRAKINQLNSS
ncbi:MAG: tRNA(Met) cytidine acetyltransferase [Colwellia sp.]|nr:tRNA(Met) cytidine acetyltransferase [Colwellia sp.]